MRAAARSSVRREPSRRRRSSAGSRGPRRTHGTSLAAAPPPKCGERRGGPMIRKLKDGRYRLYSRKKNPKTGKRRNLGTFKSRAAAEKHERAVQFFKRG